MNTPALTGAVKEQIEGILRRASEDIEFRNLLLRSPAEALRETGLGEKEQSLLAAMRRVSLEEWGVDVRRFRAFLRDNGNKA